MAKKKEREPSFEDLLAETEALVEKLESGELSLEDAMEQYEQGVKNLAQCSGLINEAQQKVQHLIEDKEGELSLADFETGDLDDNDDDSDDDDE